MLPALSRWSSALKVGGRAQRSGLVGIAGVGDSSLECPKLRPCMIGGGVGVFVVIGRGDWSWLVGLRWLGVAG